MRTLRMAPFSWTEKILKKMRITTTILVIVVILTMYLMMIIMNKQTHSLQGIRRNQEATMSNNSYSKKHKTTGKKESTRGELWQLPTPHTRNRGIEAKIKMPATSASEFTWKTISRTLRIYSSYYDRRHVNSVTGVFKRSLIIFGYEFGVITGKLFCVIIMKDNARILIDLPAVRVRIAELWKNKKDAYKAFGYRCKLTTPETPRYVTLTNATTTFKNIAFTSFISVVDPYLPAAPTQKFGVCYGSPLYGFKYDQDIIDSIEMNKLLGATWFTIYVYEANDKAMKILKYYSQKLKILNAVLNWRENLPRRAFNRGQLVALHDCIYRNMYQVQFLAFCDLDELILPQKGLNWNRLFSKIDRPERAHFVFAHLGFHHNETKPSKYFHCPSKPKLTYKMPRFFAMYKRSASPLRTPKQAKSIAKPKFVITAHVHYQKRLLPGYYVYFVPKNVAVMKHFRDKTSIYDKGIIATSDHGMDSFKHALLAAIEKHFCNNIEW